MAVYRTNMISTKDKKLIVATNNDLFTTSANINQWDDSAKNLYQWNGSANEFNIETKDIDFGDPSRRKKIYRVYVTFKAGGYMSGVIAKYAVNGSDSFTGTFNDTTYYSATKGFDSFNGSKSNSTADWITVGLKPTSTLSTTKIKSFQLKFEFANAGTHSYKPSAVEGGQLTTTGNEITLHSSASNTESYYLGMPLYFYKGPGIGTTYRITTHDSDRDIIVDSVENGLTDSDETVFASNPPGVTSYYDIGFIPRQFEINDISIIYRDKPIK